MSKRKLAVEIVWSQLLLCGGEWKTRKAIYEELLSEGFERKYVDWYVFCLAENQPKENEMSTEQPQGVFKRFKLTRFTDITGISGLGDIAVGTQWPDKSCELFWLKYGTTGHYQSMEQLQEIHCYNDASGNPNASVEWID